MNDMITPPLSPRSPFPCLHLWYKNNSLDDHPDGGEDDGGGDGVGGRGAGGGGGDVTTDDGSLGPEVERGMSRCEHCSRPVRKERLSKHEQACKAKKNKNKNTIGELENPDNY